MKIYPLITILCTQLLCACSTNLGAGLLSGSLLGAGIGGMSSGLSGSLVGTAAGLVAGTMAGISLDSQDRKIMEQSSPRTVDRMDRGEPLTINDVIKLSQAGVDDDTIINYIQDHETMYNLTQSQVRRMQDAGVSQRVINYMRKTEKG